MAAPGVAMPVLQPGSTVGIIAPSGPCGMAAFDAGRQVLQRQGFELYAGPQVTARQGYLAGNDQARYATVRRMVQAPEVAAVWAARGGYGALRIAPLLARLSPVSRPRWLVGFSDITVLHLLWYRWGWLSIHGPNVTTLAPWGEAQRAALWSLLAGEGGVELNVQHLCGPTRIARGPLLGGNLAVLASLVGTGLLPSLKGAVLLLEEIGERPYRLDRLLTQLRLAGVLDGLAGIVVGQLTDCEQAGHPSALEVFRACLEDLNLPVVAGAPVGHEPDAWPVVLGWPVTVDVGGGVVRQAGWR